MELTRSSKIAGILLAYPIAYAYLKFFLFDLSDKNVTLKKAVFVLFFIIWNELVVRGRGKTPAKETYFWYGIMGIVALTFETGLSEGVSFLGLHLCAFYVAIVSNRLCYEGKTGSFIAADLFNAQFLKGFGGMGQIFIDMAHSGRSSAGSSTQGKKASAAGAFLIILVLIPVFIVAVFLLAQINAGFGAAVMKIVKSFDFLTDFRWIINNMGYFIFAVPTAMYLYGLLGKSAASNGEAEKRSYGRLVKWRMSCRRISPVVCASVTGIFVLLYLVFFIFEAGYLFSAFAGRLPEEFTAAEYARRGFFELTGIMFINMMIYLLISYFEDRGLYGRKASVVMTAALMIESMIFAVVSFSKLALYYSRFGYTPKRLLAIWGTLIFASGAVMVIISTVRRKDMSKAWILLAAASFAAMSVLSTVLFLTLGGIR